jgi:hypothetical protein
MILNTLTAPRVSSITPPNKTDMALKSSMHYLAAYLEENLCHTAASMKFHQHTKPKLVLGPLNNLAAPSPNTNKVMPPIDPSEAMEAPKHKAHRLPVKFTLELNLLVKVILRL